MKSRIVRLAAVLVFLSVSTSVNAYIEKCGDVSGQVWPAGTYLVTCNLTVNTTLTIQPGAVIKFNPNLQMTVYGTLLAQGTSGNKIVFTSKDDNGFGEVISGSDGVPAPGDWYGIHLNGEGGNNGIGEFDWCIIRYGGKQNEWNANVYFKYSDSGHFVNSVSEESRYYGLHVRYCSPSITDSVIQSNGGDGLLIDGVNYGSSPTVTGCTFSSNERYGLMSHYASPSAINNNTFQNNGDYAALIYNSTLVPYTGNTATGNAINGFVVSGTIGDGSVMSSNLPFVLKGQVAVGGKVTISEGTVIKGLSDGYLYVYGTLDVNGVSGKPVIFTSIKDDTYGGDTNNDGNGSSPTPGDWPGIRLNGEGGNNGIGEFDWCILRYGGVPTGTVNGVAYFQQSDSGHIANSIIEYSVFGVQVNGCSPSMADSIFRHNTYDGLYLYISSASSVTGCTFSSNGRDGIYASGSPAINNNTFENNSNYAALMDNSTIVPYAGNTATGNVINGFVLTNTIGDGSVMSSNLPFVLSGKVTVGGKVTVSEGTVIKGLSDGYLLVYGTLDVNGTSGKPVIFTSIKDDTYGGDTNNDGNSSSPSPQDWIAIHLFGYGDTKGIGEFDWCIIRYGGKTGPTYGARALTT